MSTYTTSRGIEITFLSIAQHLENLRAARKKVAVPTYDIVTALGVTEHFALDRKSLDEHPEQFTSEQHKQLEEYETQSLNEEIQFNTRLTRLMMLYGIKCDEPDGWVARQQSLGLSVPEDATERRLHFLETEVFGTREDYNEATLGVMRESGASDDLLAQVAETFRGSIRENPAGESADSGEPVDGESSVRGSASGGAPASDDKPVGRAKRNR